MHTRRAPLPPTRPRLAAVLLAAMCACGDGKPVGALAQVTGFGSNPGNLLMYAYTPASPPPNAALVVVLHGCTQSAAELEASGWSAAADAYGFHVVYPQQQSANNRGGCFNWFEPGDTARGEGEVLSIRQMVAYRVATASVDAARVFVVGVSAGGFMASALLAAYPDVFAGGAIDAGGPHGCARSLSEATLCMSPGVTRTPAAWGDLVRSAYPGYTGARPRVSLWHGSLDGTVDVVNLTESMKQWTDVHGIAQTADTRDTVGTSTHAVYRDAAGRALVETYELAQLGHAIAVDPQLTFPGTGAGCGSAGTYFVDADLCATQLQAQFFGLTDIDSRGAPAKRTKARHP